MKKLGLLILAAAAIACTNLDEVVYSSISKDTFFASEKMLSIYSARAYTSLQAWGSEQSMWTLCIQLGNEVTVPKNADGEWKDPRYGELQTHKILINNKLVEQGWNYCFNGIAACNDIIYEVEKSGKDFDGKDKILAEMHILRAFYYFLAVDCWGNVPYSVSKEDKSYPVQKDRAFMCKFIEDEILAYRDILSEDSSPAYYGRVTKWMANTLLAKLYLNSEEWTGTPRWEDAEAACLAVIESGKYSLCPDYTDNFKVKNEGSPEAIFSIPYSTVYTESDHNAFILFILTLDGYLAPTYNINSSVWDGFIGQPDFFASYEDGDLRREATWLHGPQYDASGNLIHAAVKDPKTGVVLEEFDYIIDPLMEGFSYGQKRTHIQGARIGKWEFQKDGLINSDQTSMDNDFHLFRYADVVLMYVEALLRQGKADGNAKAINDFDTIRTRAGLSPLGIAELNLDDLYLERSHELALEGWVRQDLIRFGKYLDSWWGKPAGQEYMKLLPIPDAKRKSNPNLVQNPGY